MQAITYNTEGKAVGKVELPESVFGQPWSPDLVHEVVLAMQANARAGTAHTKVRGEVRGGGKKPWRQKGTGRARHGSRRSPIWRGGGVTFGPRNERDYSQKINRNVRAKALGVALSQKLRDDEIICLDTMLFVAPKAKEARGMLTALSGVAGKGTLATKRKNAAVIVLGGRDGNTEKSFQNFGNVVVTQAKDLNPVELLSYKYVILAGAETVAKLLESRIVSKGKTPRTASVGTPVVGRKSARPVTKTTKKVPTKSSKKPSAQRATVVTK